MLVFVCNGFLCFWFVIIVFVGWLIVDIWYLNCLFLLVNWWFVIELDEDFCIIFFVVLLDIVWKGVVFFIFVLFLLGYLLKFVGWLVLLIRFSLMFVLVEGFVLFCDLVDFIWGWWIFWLVVFCFVFEVENKINLVWVIRFFLNV